jgi:hypothetical protein
MPPAEDSQAPLLELDGILAALGFTADDAVQGVPYAVLRGRYGPRWLLPERSQLALTILREWRPYGAWARLLWLAAPMAARMGALTLMPGATKSQLPSNASAQFLRRIGREFDASLPVILVGNTVATRKLLVFLEDRTQRTRMLVKVPLMPLARVSILNEARALRQLNGRFRAPQLLYVDEDAAIATQEYLAGKLGSRRLKPDYVRLLLDLVDTSRRTSLRAYCGQLAERLRACPGYEGNAARLDAALLLLDQGEAISLALIHGDFVPWNIRELPDGSCTLIDWELARENGLPLYDLCHFYYMQSLLFAPDELFYLALLKEGAWRAYCTQLGIPDSLLAPLAAAFLLEILAGYWEIPETSVDGFCLRQLDLLLGFTGARVK